MPQECMSEYLHVRRKLTMEGRGFKQSMLGYCKTVLEKMSFSKKLFLKEYRKSLSRLSPEERDELRRWVRESENTLSES